MAARSCWPRTSDFIAHSSRRRIRSCRRRPSCLSNGAPKTGTSSICNAGPLANLRKVPEGKSALWDDQVRHDTYDDYWKARNLAPHMKNIHCAVLTVGGWFDAEDLQGPFTTFHAIDKNNSGIFNALVVGPWVHGGWARYDGEHLGRVEFAANTGEYYRKKFSFRFLSSISRATATPSFRRHTSLRRARTCGGNIPRGRRRMPSARLCIFMPGADCRSTRPRRRLRLRRICERSGQAGAVRELRGAECAAGIHALGPALRRQPHGRVGLRNTGFAGRRDHRGADLAATFRFNQRY